MVEEDNRNHRDLGPQRRRWKDYVPGKEDKFAQEFIVYTRDNDGLVQYLWWGRGLKR